MSKTQSIVITPVLADDSKTLLVPVYYRVASDDVANDPASVNLAGVGAVVTFDSSKLTFDGYTAELGRDLFQGPTLFSESALRDHSKPVEEPLLGLKQAKSMEIHQQMLESRSTTSLRTNCSTTIQTPPGVAKLTGLVTKKP